ncbi:PMKase [Intoshia linei]|uniref:Phosphomevalonate kinase n=1 Tax=Intoshia linei TaxID=1819745 RepID=A0A177BEP2_9BILA|nr:PMKase [Intoshia linei]
MQLPKLVILISGKRKCGKDFYSNVLTENKDLEKNDLVIECQQFEHYTYQKCYCLFFPNQNKVIKVDKLESPFPNIELYMKMFASTMVANCNMNNELRNCLDHPRLNALSLMYIENDISNDISFDNIISDFSQKKGPVNLTIKDLKRYPGCKVITMAKPVKRVFAEKYNLDYDLMCTDSNYKEKYRKEMIKWVIDNTKVDVDYLAKLTLQQYDKYSPILIVSDVRRVTDADYFKVFFKETNCKLIRIAANLDARKLRGFKFVPGIDDCPSECNMDAYEYDYLIDTSTNSTLEKTKNDFEPYIDALFK